MTDSPSKLAPRHRHDKGLVLIAAYKLLQALLFVAIGVGAVRLLNKDAADVLASMADRLHFNSEWRLVKFILDKAGALNWRLFPTPPLAFLRALDCILKKPGPSI